MSISPGLLFAASAGASALGGALGMASGIFIVPLLTLGFGVDFHVAVGASLVSVIACSCGSAGSFLKSRLTNIRLAVVLEAATTAGAACGVLIAGIVSASALYAIFAAVLVTSAWQMLARRRVDLTPAEAAEASAWLDRFSGVYPDPATGRDVGYRVQRIPLALTLMYAAGLLSALLGIGSGVLKIPAMDTALRLPIKVSSATSNFMIGVTAAGSAGAYYLQGAIAPEIAGPIALGSVIGAILGARLLIAINPASLRLLFVGVLLLLSVEMALAAVGIRIGVGH